MVGIDKDVMVDGYLFGLVEETKRMNGLDVTSTCFKYPKLSCSPHLHDSGSHFCCCFFPGFVSTLRKLIMIAMHTSDIKDVKICWASSLQAIDLQHPSCRRWPTLCKRCAKIALHKYNISTIPNPTFHARAGSRDYILRLRKDSTS